MVDRGQVVVELDGGGKDCHLILFLLILLAVRAEEMGGGEVVPQVLSTTKKPRIGGVSAYVAGEMGGGEMIHQNLLVEEETEAKRAGDMIFLLMPLELSLLLKHPLLWNKEGSMKKTQLTQSPPPILQIVLGRGVGHQIVN